jgi:hypothetical protein
LGRAPAALSWPLGIATRGGALSIAPGSRALGLIAGGRALGLARGRALCIAGRRPLGIATRGGALRLLGGRTLNLAAGRRALRLFRPGPLGLTGSGTLFGTAATAGGGQHLFVGLVEALAAQGRAPALEVGLEVAVLACFEVVELLGPLAVVGLLGQSAQVLDLAQALAVLELLGGELGLQGARVHVGAELLAPIGRAALRAPRVGALGFAAGGRALGFAAGGGALGLAPFLAEGRQSKSEQGQGDQEALQHGRLRGLRARDGPWGTGNRAQEARRLGYG